MYMTYLYYGIPLSISKKEYITDTHNINESQKLLCWMKKKPYTREYNIYHMITLTWSSRTGNLIYCGIKSELCL